jgi:hypothetical protein
MLESKGLETSIRLGIIPMGKKKSRGKAGMDGKAKFGLSLLSMELWAMEKRLRNSQAAGSW